MSLLLLFELETLFLTEVFEGVNPVFTAFYMTMITITTVGYGDIVPQTMSGRIVIVFAAIHGVILVSFVVAAVSNMVQLEENERTAIDKIDHSRVAAKAISKSFKYFQHKK